jgi:copper chaperone NosL
MRLVARLTGLACIAALAGCLPGDRDRPPSFRLGEESCAQCRMIISDERFAAALASEAGEPLKFDDVGCLVLHEQGLRRSGTTLWVHEYLGSAWVKADDVWFVHSRRIASPMGYGLGAVAQGHRAGAGEEDSRLLRFDQLYEVLNTEPDGSDAGSLKAQLNGTDK